MVTLLIMSYIFRTFQNEEKDLGNVADVFKRIIAPEYYVTLIGMLLLVPVNWALESLKWRQLAKKVVALSFRDAFRGTLTGLAIGVAAPAQVGDTIGRIAALRSDNRLQAIGAALVSNGIQFYISVVAGAAGWFFIQQHLKMSNHSKQLLNLLLITIILLGWIVASFRKSLLSWHPSNRYVMKLHTYLAIIGKYTAVDLLLSAAYGTLRYLVFLTQFILALSMFNFPLTYPELCSCVALIFLAKTLIPAINVLGDLGLREFTALFVFKSYNLPPEEIITATFLIWIVNVLGPIMVGIFLIWKYKWKNVFN